MREFNTVHRKRFVAKAHEKMVEYERQLNAARLRAHEGAIPKPKYAEDAIQSHIKNAQQVSSLETAYNKELYAVENYDSLKERIEKLEGVKGRKRELYFAKLDLLTLCRLHEMPPPSADYERAQVALQTEQESQEDNRANGSQALPETLETNP